MHLAKHIQAIIILIALIYCIGYWGNGIILAIQDPKGFWECFTLVLGLFKEMLVG